MEKKPTQEELLKKIESFKKRASVDLNVAEDLSIAVMNMISLEEHFFFTALKTKKDKYLDLLNEIRAERKIWLAELMPRHEGETWCISKHLLAASMRLFEVGNKFDNRGEKAKAKQFFQSAYKIYSLFWKLKLDLMEKPIENKAKNFSQLEKIIEKLADCCDE